jgi:hypothetical protein
VEGYPNGKSIHQFIAVKKVNEFSIKTVLKRKETFY